jgi:GTPase Era involved in 16S rRNA processing
MRKMNNQADFFERKHNLIDSAAKLEQIVYEKLEGRDINLLKNFQDELKHDLSFKLLCIGDFSTGKSTFINKFLLKQDILPTWATPTTTRLTRIKYGPKLRTSIYYQDGTREELEKNVAESLLDTVSTKGASTGNVNHVVLEIPSESLIEDVEIIDAPGLNDPDASRMKVTFDYLQQADAILFFINAMKPWTDYEKNIFEQEILTIKDLDKLYVLANYWDQIEPDQREEVEGYINQRLKESVKRIEAKESLVKDLQVLPISSKTGENADKVQSYIWDALTKRKSFEVLSLRANKLNNYIDSYLLAIDAQIQLAKLSQDERDKRRSEVERDIKYYEQQRSQLIKDIERFLEPEFDDYAKQISGLFDRLSIDVQSIIAELVSANLSQELLNLKINTRLRRAQNDLVVGMKHVDRQFLKRVIDIIEQQKGHMNIPLKINMELEDYFLNWQRVADAGKPNALKNIVKYSGVAGTLTSAATYFAQPLIVEGVLTIVRVKLAGGVLATTALSTLGIASLTVAGLALIIYVVLKGQGDKKASDAFIMLSAQLEAEIDNKRNEAIKPVIDKRDDNITKICNDIDHEIIQTYEHKRKELDQISTSVDEVAGLKILRGDIFSLRVRVN